MPRDGTQKGGSEGLGVVKGTRAFNFELFDERSALGGAVLVSLVEVLQVLVAASGNHVQNLLLISSDSGASLEQNLNILLNQILLHGARRTSLVQASIEDLTRKDKRKTTNVFFFCRKTNETF